MMRGHRPVTAMAAIKPFTKELFMKRQLLSIAAASLLFASVGVASAQTTTTTTWSTENGNAIREYSTTQKYESFRDPAMHPNAGMALPGTVTLYPLPDTVQVPSRETYSYGIINDRPVVVERTTRKVVHTWDQ
jgi:hypothetical protein